MAFRIRERLAGFTAFGQTLRSVRPIRLAISGIVTDGVSRQASRIIPDVFPTLSRPFPDLFPTSQRRHSPAL